MHSACRRPWKVLVAAIVGVALAATVGATGTAGAQTAPSVAIQQFSHRCADPSPSPNEGIMLTVAGTSNQSQLTVTLRSPSGSVLQSHPTDVGDGRWSQELFWNYSQTGTYEIRASVPGAPASASVFLEVPCVPPTLEYDPPCFTPGQSLQVTMTGRHFLPYDDGTMVYDAGGTETQSRSRIPIDGRGVFRAAFSVKPSARNHPGRAQDNRQNAATATWSPCPSRPTVATTTTLPPIVDTTTTSSVTSTTTVSTTTTTSLPPPTAVTLQVLPALGPPGTVTHAVGTGFPPGPVELRWDPGIGVTKAMAAADGSFAVPVLVFPKDRLGARALVAEGAGGVTAEAAFLVLPSTVQPSASDVTQINRTRRFLQR